MLIISPPRPPDVSALPMPTSLSGSLDERVGKIHPSGIISLLMLAITYIQVMTTINRDTVGSTTTQHVAYT